MLRVLAAHLEPDGSRGTPARVAPELAAELRLMAGWLGMTDVVPSPDARGDLVPGLLTELDGGTPAVRP